MGTDPPTAQRPGQRRRRRWPVVFVAALALFFVLECSGIQFPMWDARGTLDRHLSADLGVPLPAGARVTHAVWVAMRDPGEYFAVEMPGPAEAAALVARVRAAAGPGAVQDDDPAWPWTMGPVPDWWRPADLAGAMRMQVRHKDQLGGYIWYYSESAGTVYVFWYRI